MDCRQILSSFYRITKERENSRELSEICKNLKSQGPRLDEEYKQEMDKVQTELVSLCQNVELDPTVRLEMLELIELRATGWKVTEELEKYFFDQQETEDRIDPDSAIGDIDVTNRSVSSQYQDEKVEELQIGDFRLTLRCSDRTVLQLSKQHLANFFKTSHKVSITTSYPPVWGSDQPRPEVRMVEFRAEAQPPPALKYSREEILRIANNPQSKDEPFQWEELKKRLPDAVIKKSFSHSSSRQFKSRSGVVKT